jgi:peptidyl-prolyl cis-trans isomerase C
MRAFLKAPLCAASLLAVALLAACNKPQSTSSATSAPPSPPVAVVNGTAISHAEFDVAVKDLLQGKQRDLTPDEKNQFLDQLIGMQLLAAQGEKDGLENDPDTQAQLQLLHARVLADAESQKYIKAQQPSDADLHAEYETAVAGMDKTEFKARHILVSSKDQADQVIKKLKGGAKFEDLAKSLSIDNGSKVNGGDLGWFNSSRMVKPFGDAVKQLKKGETTQEPVQTQYGWHVIQLEDTREAAPPPFDQVKGQLANAVIRKKLQAYVADLKKQAQIDKKLDTGAAPASGAAPAPGAAPSATPQTPAPASGSGDSKP